jgi:HK97 family phage major capsid protein
MYGIKEVTELREKRRALRAKAEAILDVATDKSRNLSETEQREFDGYLDEVKRLDLEIASHATRGARTLEDTDGHDDDGMPIVKGRDGGNNGASRILTRDQSFASAVGAGDPQYRSLGFGQMMRALLAGAKTPLERRALAEGSDSAGGYTVPEILFARIIDRLRTVSTVFRAGASTVPLTSSESSFAFVASDPTPSWKAENVQMDITDPTFGRIIFYPRTCVCLVLASRELLEDSINIETGLEMIFAKTMANEIDRVALVGKGSDNEPTGLRLRSIGVVDMGASGASLTNYNPLVDLQQTLADNNAQPTTAMIMAPRTAASLSKLQDQVDQPLRRPDSLVGLPFFPTTQVGVTDVVTDTTHSDASRVYAGAWPDLVIGLRSEMRVEVLRERFIDYYQVGFLAHMRLDIALYHEKSFAQLINIRG